MIQDLFHQKIIENYSTITDWFKQKSKDIVFPVYSSFDIRDSSVKITPVDANLFPAGFNNICKEDQQNSISIFQSYLKVHFPATKKIILLAEEHTHNPFYWDNIHTLKTLLTNSGIFVDVCVPGQNIQQDNTFISANGHEIPVSLLSKKINNSDLIISNNDFSRDYKLQSPIPIIPAVKVGWNTRRKHSFFEQYNLLATEFANLINWNPQFLTIKTTRFTDFKIDDPKSLKKLQKAVEEFLLELEPIYKNTLYKNQEQKPFVFLKNNAGTYGLGMTTIFSAKDIEDWNYKIRKKMKATKGGGLVSELIIQEGITSCFKQEGNVAEPVIYLIGSVLAGGFLRTHKTKGIRDNLNSPGAVYRRLCLSDLKIEIEGKPMENVYGWVAYLGVLALAREIHLNKNEK